MHAERLSSFSFITRVKQLEAHQARVENDMHEMDKPLARDKNDEDLDAHLKAVEREEDPMLKYIRKKQSKAKAGLPRKLGKTASNQLKKVLDGRATPSRITFIYIAFSTT